MLPGAASIISDEGRQDIYSRDIVFFFSSKGVRKRIVHIVVLHYFISRASLECLERPQPEPANSMGTKFAKLEL